MATQQQQAKLAATCGPLQKPFSPQNFSAETRLGMGRLLMDARTELHRVRENVDFSFGNAAHDLHLLLDWTHQDFGNAAVDLGARMAIEMA